MRVRLVQISHARLGRRVGVVDEPRLRVLAGASSVYELALQAIRAGARLEDVIGPAAGGDALDYDEVYHGRSEWTLLPPFDYPGEASRCFVTGTGLTHKASVETRQAMHGQTAVETDSMKMYRIGLDGGRPAPGEIGAAPEWFYKGIGTCLRAPNAPLDVPGHACDGGDEAEIAGAYVIDDQGNPWRVGLVQANEFSDHVLEAKNYLYLAHSKLRACSIGPEIVIGGDLSHSVSGQARIERAGKVIWSAPLASGEANMSHTLANLEHHHFKHAEHRRAGDAHIHFLGADRFSFKDHVRLEEGDVMVIAFEGFGRALRNPIRIDRSPERLITVRAL